MHGNLQALTVMLFVFLAPLQSPAADQAEEKISLEDHIRANVPSKEELDVFLHEMSWAQFDPDVGYILGNYMPRDGMDGSSTFSTVQPNGARTSFLYPGVPCRINTYGNSFTQCHQVSDGETWQEYLAAHLGEPVGNFGMGGFGLYQAYRRMLREEQTDHGAEYKSFNLSVDDYFKRYFIGYYNPAGNHFFAYSLKDRVVDWLEPKPLPYRDTKQRIIDFKGYLQEY